MSGFLVGCAAVVALVFVAWIWALLSVSAELQDRVERERKEW